MLIYGCIWICLSFLALWFTVWILLDWNGMDAIDHPVHMHEHGGGVAGFLWRGFSFLVYYTYLSFWGILLFLICCKSSKVFFRWVTYYTAGLWGNRPLLYTYTH